MTHTGNIGLSWNDFIAFTNASGHPPVITRMADRHKLAHATTRR